MGWWGDLEDRIKGQPTNYERSVQEGQEKAIAAENIAIRAETNRINAQIHADRVRANKYRTFKVSARRRWAVKSKKNTPLLSNEVTLG